MINENQSKNEYILEIYINNGSSKHYNKLSYLFSKYNN